MSNITILKTIIENLKSDKVKQRQEALVALRDACSQDRVLASIQYNDEGNRLPKHWLAIFQALFCTVQIEKKAATHRTTSKSGLSTAASLRRLSEAANTVRWLIERTVQFMTKTIVRVVFTHLLSMLPSVQTADAELFAPVALDYAKALKCIVTYTPHLEHLDDDTWIKVVQMAFNVVLGDPIQSRFAGRYAGEESESGNETHSDMYEDDSEEEDQQMADNDSDDIPGTITVDRKRHRTPAATPAISRKRPRTHSPPTPTQSPRNTPSRSRTPVSLEQVEFASLLSIMIGSPIAPILRFSELSSAILNRLERFLHRYPSDSSLLHDFLAILSSTLSHISLNKKSEVAKFARSAWPGLVGLWGTKDKRMKAGIIKILRQLFQFTVCPVELSRVKLPQFDCAKEFGRLRDLLAGEAESRWGITGLSLDALRLQNIPYEEEFKRSSDIFVAKTFRAGWNFDGDQALSWAVLELYADCVGQLYQLSESMESSHGTGLSRIKAKSKSLDPISSILESIHSASIPITRIYHLQTLLFVIDHHWPTFHTKLKEQIVEGLLQYVAIDHAIVQSWVFLNLTAIVQAEGSLARRLLPTTLDSVKWDSIWTHAVRRVNVPAMCRAACHAGYAILVSHPYSSKSTWGLSSHRILSEIEALTKDIDIQGPAYPYDSVCNFLSQCLGIASQDSRLHRMHLEENVLSWLVDAWKIVENKTKMPSNTVADVVTLLEAICGLQKRVELLVMPPIHQSEIADAVLEENKVKVVQGYILDAKLPPFTTDTNIGSNIFHAKQFSSSDGDRSDRSQLSVYNGRGRKISAFLLNALKTLIDKWDPDTESGVHATIEMARQSLDIAIIGIVFETLLALNGTTSNRQVLQTSAKLLSILVVLIKNARWSTTERLLLAHALEILINNGQAIQVDDFNQDPLSTPGLHSGIKEQTLQGLLPGQHRDQKSNEDVRYHLLREIWQSSDLQEALDLSISILRTTMSDLLVGPLVTSNKFITGQEDRDGFGSIRMAHQNSKLDSVEGGDKPIEHIFQICIGFISYGPFLKSLSAEPTEDKDLAREIVDSATHHPERFVLMCPIYFNAIRQGILHLPTKQLSDFFDIFGNLLQQYTYSRNERFHRLVLYLLVPSIGLWKSQDLKMQKLQNKFCDLCSWLCKIFIVDEKKRIPLGFRSWALRDAFAQFLDSYLSEDPTQAFWPGQDTQEFPSSMLLTMNTDEDTRVRFRAATIMSTLCSQKDAQAYGRVAESFPVYVDKFEHILTRLLALGNIMIVNSALRGGSYWHLLEISLYHDAYCTHIETILTGVSDRLGISPFSALFEAHAAQIVHCVNDTDRDFMDFPPRILGYTDRKQFSEATFRVLAPFYILNDRIEDFGRHCKLVQKSVSKGIEDCFGDVVGFIIADRLSKISYPTSSSELDSFIQGKLSFVSNYTSLCEENLDGIITQLFRSLGDQDCSEKGPIALELQKFDDNSQTMRLFRVANHYRILDTFSTHMPNRPAHPTGTVLNGLAWLKERYPNAFSKATTYHVIQGLMNDIQRTPLVNEQVRLINALTLWMACRHQDIQDVAILQIVTQAATLLLFQWDLARSAQSILELTFRLYKNVTFKDARFSNVLIRICSTAHDYATNHQNKPISELGITLESWIDQQVYSMTKSPCLQDLVIRALPAWPRQPSSQLLPLFDETSLQSLAFVLEDQQITSNKFRIVRRFKQQTARYGHNVNDDPFANTYFWRLKDCMPSPEMLQDQDAESFADLLFLHHGQIRSFDVESHNLNKTRNRHVRNIKSKNPESQAHAACDAITLGLLMMLEDDQPSKVYNAYNTLRFIAAVSSSQNPRSRMPSEYQTGLDLLRIHRRSPLNRPFVAMADLLQSDAYVNAACNFTQWISLLTILLSDTLSTIDPFYGQLSSILTSDTTFAEEILPILIYTLLQNDKKVENDAQSSKKLLSNYFTSILSTKSTDFACVRAIVDVVLHLRYFTPQADRLSYNKWLDIDFTLLAQSAILCGAYTTALLFVELAAEHDRKIAEKDDTIEQVLYDIYAHIDEPDGFYGINTQDLRQFLIKRFHHEHQWDKAFRFHGASLEAGITANGEQQGLVDSFHSFGFDRLAIDALQKITEDSSFGAKPSAMSFELGWRTENWDLPDQSQAAGAPLYRALRAIHRERDPRMVGNTIGSCLLQEAGRLRSLGSENLAEIRAVSRDLMCLSQVKEWWEIIGQELKPDNILSEWDKLADMDTRFEFADLEPIMATRISLVRSVRQREERRQIGTLLSPSVRSLRDIEKRCLIRLSEAARASGQVQIALNSVVKAQRLDLQPTPDVSAEFAHVLWVLKEEKMAVQHLKQLVDVSTIEDASWDLEKKALWLSRLGTWTSEAYLAKPIVIWEQCFSRAIEILDQLQSPPPVSEVSQARVYRECAMFAERQYHVTLQSPDALRWKVYVDRKKKEIEDRSQEMAKVLGDKHRHKKLEHEQIQANRILSEDSELFNKHNTLRESFLKQAIAMHSRCLAVSSQFDNDSAVRFCSLWFANFDDLSILETVRQGLERIPSRKLVFLAHQLTARVAHSSWANLPPAQQNLQNLVMRMCQEHPFHSLYQVYCSADHTTHDLNRRQSGAISSQATQNTQTERGAAASNILNRLRDDPVTGNRVRDVELLCDAYKEWAKFVISKNSAYKAKSSFDVPPGIKLLKLQNIKVPVATARTPVDSSMKYDNCAWLKCYDRKFSTAGGINLPKISICHDMEGQSYKQLFKGEGKDDLRQDAVMEQVFDLVNSVLKQDRETRRRQLQVRDYKVIPLDAQAGLLEFVGNTTPMRDWLVAAHVKYRPQDEKPTVITEKIRKFQTAYPNRPDKQMEAFLFVKKKFKPVMRHYFTENHKNPISWFKMRLRYSRSVATTSIVGHVLGLGDRHSSNILIDNVTGDVVHIDLGIAFDQGKRLPVPERVPFRMTADIVDGMGISGTSGVFQRCAEETLRVLREESGVIMTVLEVFKHDPLHSWTASETKVKQAQSEVPMAEPNVNDTTRFNLGIGIDINSGSAEEAADRALSSVARKLDKSLSVESTVNELVAEATDNTNLATIYHGWGAHL